MSRVPFQIPVIPFRKNAGGVFEFAVFKRNDDGNWQGIAGGGESNETPVEAVRREAFEEAKIPNTLKFYTLHFKGCVPVNEFASSKFWPKNLYVVIEHFFAVDCTGIEFTLSQEHSEYKWVNYETGKNLLKWDSNKNALWELNERLLNDDMILM